MSKILSIIVPSYNMENFLPYCIESLLVESNRDVLEVLIVNDGSNDRTLIIGQNYEKAYPELIRVIDKKNGNYGSCINVALPQATGKYVKVLDADDSFDTANFDKFLGLLKDIDADLVLSDFEIVDEKRECQRTVHYDFSVGVIMLFSEIVANRDFVNEIQMHAVTYRRDLLMKLNYRQTEGISYTDQQWIFTPMFGVKLVAYFDTVVYQYLVGREGQTMDPKVKVRSMKHAQKNSLGLVLDYEKHKHEIVNGELRNYFYSRLTWYIKDIYVFYITHYSGENRVELREYDDRLKYLSQEIYNLVGNKQISSICGLAYIDYWRKHKLPVVLVRTIGRMYKYLLNIRARKSSVK